METSGMGGSRIPDPRLDLHESIRRRAEEIYIQSGRIPGRDVENWTQAEREIRQMTAQHKKLRAVVVKLQGVQYVGEYTEESADGYVPGEIGPGASVAVRFEDDTMFVRRGNGKELETHIVRKIE